MIDNYLNQRVIWKKVVGVDAYGKPSLSQSIISARVEEQNKLIRSKTGEQVISVARLFVKDPVMVDDRITLNDKNYIVLSVESCMSLDGEEVYRIVWL